MKSLIRYLLIALALATPLTAYAENSMLRITCEGINVGAEVKINGKFRGECPVDLQVAPGTLKLKVTKKKDEESFWLFEQDVRMGEGSVKKVEVVMHWRWNDAELKRMDAPIADVLVRANKGQALEQWELGNRYSDGKKGASKDREEAIKWYRKAANQGYAAAQNSLSAEYYVLGDYAESLKWSRTAAEQGDSDAQSGLGSKYERGVGVSQDCQEAMKWFSRAADQGSQTAQMGIGRLYEKGCGVTLDKDEAVKWYGKAAAGSGEFEAGMARDALNYLLKH